MTLEKAVTAFVANIYQADDTALALPWAWRAYDGEGVRFACFRTLEELRELTVEILDYRSKQQSTATVAQRILAQHHSAYWELKAILLGIDDGLLQQQPGEDDWSVLRTLGHIVGGEITFYGIVLHALTKHRQDAGWQPAPPTESDYDRLLGMSEEEYTTAVKAGYDSLMATLADFHERVLRDFAAIEDDELQLPSHFWEGEPFSLRFRLHRFESHLRQHTIQIEKTLAQLGRADVEGQRLARLLYAALGTAQGAQLGADALTESLTVPVAERIAQRAQAIAAVIEAK